MSEYFWTYFGWSALGFTVTAAVIGLTVLAFPRGAKGMVSPESRLLWVKPLVVFAGVVSLLDNLGMTVTPAVILGIGLIVGLACGMTSIPPMLFVRDVILGIIAAVSVLFIAILRLTDESEMRVVYVALLIAMGVGLLLGGFKKWPQPISLLAALGAFEIVDYLLSPFGPANYPGVTLSMFVIGIVGALTFGVLTRVRPEFVIYLAGTTITVMGVVLPIFLWFETQNYPGRIPGPDWTIFFAWLGLSIGYPLTRGPLLFSRVKSLG